MTHLRHALLASFVAATTFSVSCAHRGGTDAPSSPSTESAASPQEEDNAPLVTPAEVPWKQMTTQQRARYMNKVFTPRMKEVFQAYDPKEFATFNCATCHGKNAKENGFKMPSPQLTALPASPEVFMATVMKEKPEMVKFMGEKVVAETARLLGLQPYNPAAPVPDAFSCSGCHTLKDTVAVVGH